MNDRTLRSWFYRTCATEFQCIRDRSTLQSRSSLCVLYILLLVAPCVTLFETELWLSGTSCQRRARHSLFGLNPAHHVAGAGGGRGADGREQLLFPQAGYGMRWLSNAIHFPRNAATVCIFAFVLLLRAGSARSFLGNFFLHALFVTAPKSKEYNMNPAHGGLARRGQISFLFVIVLGHYLLVLSCFRLHSSLRWVLFLCELEVLSAFVTYWCTITWASRCFTSKRRKIVSVE